MDRRRVTHFLSAAAAAALAGAILSCSNPIDIVEAITTQVMVANGRFLLVNEVTPSKNATEVNTYGSFLIEFDRDIDPDTISADTITVDPAVNWTSKYNATTRILTITPDYLESVTWYTVTVGSGVKGTDGSALQDPYVWTFQTKQGPGGSLLINGGDAYANDPAVTYTITANFAVTQYRISLTDPPTFDAGDNDWVTKGTPFTDPLPGSDGTKKIYIQFMDVNNNRTPKTAISESIVLDTTQPVVSAGTLAWLNAANPSRTTTATATDATSGIASYAWTGPSLTFGNDAALNTSVSRTADGTSTATLTVTDKAGNARAVNLTVNRDLTPPVVTTPTLPWINVANGSQTEVATATDASAKTYAWTAPAQVTIGSPTALTTTLSSSTDGVYTATLAVTDVAGNVTTSNLTVNVDRTPPTVSAFSIAANAAAVNTATVALSITASSGTAAMSQMQFANNAGGYSTLEAYSSTKTGYAIDTSGGQVSTTVHVKVTDAAGNTSGIYSDATLYDTVVPVITLFTVGSGNPASTNSPNVTLYITATDTGGSGVSQSRYWNTSWTAYEGYATTRAWTLPNNAGTRTVWIGVKDLAGNYAQISDSIILNAKITVTFSQINVSNDGDNVKGDTAGDMYYYFYIDGVTKLYRTSTNTLAVTSPADITTNLPVSSYTIYRDPTAGSFQLTGYLFDLDTSTSEYGTLGPVTYTAPFSDVRSATRAIAATVGAVAGTLYYSVDFVNP